MGFKHENGEGTDIPAPRLAAVQVGEFLQPMLASLDPPLVFEAAKGLLTLGTLGSHHSPAAVQPTWAPLAVAALVELWDRPPHGPAGSQLLNLIVCHLDQLQVGPGVRLSLVNGIRRLGKSSHLLLCMAQPGLSMRCLECL